MIATTPLPSPADPERHAFIVLSNAHVSKETVSILDEDAVRAFKGDQTMWVAKTPFGWFLYVEEEPHANGYPEELVAIFAYARKQGVRYVMLDRDADTVEELATYEW